MKKSNFVGQSYDYNTFEEFLIHHHTGTLYHFTLTSPDGREIDCELDLHGWFHYLETNPLPDPAATYDFVGGLCPDLPGYYVTETVAGIPFTGVCETELDCALKVVGEAGVPALRLPVLGLLILVLVAVTAVIWGRRRQA